MGFSCLDADAHAYEKTKDDPDCEGDCPDGNDSEPGWRKGKPTSGGSVCASPRTAEL
jgi:hypothetical protein